MFLLADTGYAFYIPDEIKAENFSFRKGSIPSSKKDSAFALYDNFEHFSADQPLEPIIFPRSDNFVPADLIDCRLPVYSVFNSPEPAGDPIANLLYMNLEFKNLLKEYKALQKKAREILAILEASYNSPKSDLPSLINGIRVENARDPDGVFNLDERLSAYKIWVNLNRRAGAVTKEVRLSSISEGTSATLTLGFNGDFIYLHDPQAGPMNPFGSDTSRLRVTGSVKPAGGIGSVKPTGGIGSVKPTKVDNLYVGDHDFVLWLINAPMNLINYLIQNKIEAAVCGLFLIVIANIVIWIRSQ